MFCEKRFFNKVAAAPPTLLKKETLAQVFSCEFCEISKNTSFYRTPLVAAPVNTITSEKTNELTTYKKNDKTTTHRDKDDSKLGKRQSTNSSMVKKEVVL